MKKIKVLTSLVGLTGLSMGLVPVITGCSCNPSSNVELDKSVTDQNITVKSASIVKGKDSTIEFNIKSAKQISKITLNIGNATLSETDVKIETAKVTIPAIKMVDDKVIVKSITLGDADVKITSITITNTTTSVTIGAKLELTASVAPETATNKELKWTVTAGTGSATITTQDSKTYLEGATEGTVSVVAEAKDGSGIKSSAVTFNIVAAVKREVCFVNNGAVDSSITVGYISENGTMQWSQDGDNWNTITSGTIKTITSGGGKFYLRGTGFNSGESPQDKHVFDELNHIIITGGAVELSGTIADLIDYTLPLNQIQYVASMFMYGFANSNGLKSIPAGFLPAIEVRGSIYYSMFEGCSNLTKAPNLPAMTLYSSCYRSMFKGCSSLTKTPDLPAETLAKSCYCDMFNACTGLKEAPMIAATKLAQGACKNMFYDCNNLKIKENDTSGTTKFFLCPDTTGLGDCVEGMFLNTSGSYISDPTTGNTYYFVNQ